MAELHRPRTRQRADGSTAYVADYVAAGRCRRQTDHDAVEAARLEAERLDTRIRPDISLAGYLLNYGENLPPHLKPQTAAVIKRRLRRCADFAPDVQLAHAGPSHIEEMERAMRRGGLSRITAICYLETATPALERALVDRRVETNIVRRYFEVPGRRKVPLPRPLDPAPLTDIMTVAAHMEDHLGPAILAARGAGLSAREAVCLQRRDIDRKLRRITVRRTLGSSYAEEPLNPAAVRHVFNVDADVIEALLAAPQVVDGGDWVMQAIGRIGPLSRITVYSDLLVALKAAQVATGVMSLDTELPYRFDDFRDRWVVERLQVDGVLAVMAMAGYSSFPHFAARYRSAFLDPQAHEQMALAMDGIDLLASLGEDEE